MQVVFVKRTKRQCLLEGIGSRLFLPDHTDIVSVRLEVCELKGGAMVRAIAEYTSGGYGRGNWCALSASQVNPWVFKAVKDAEWIVKQRSKKHGRKKTATQRKTSAGT